MLKILNIILLIVWMCIIFMLSNQPADDSSSLSSGIVKKTYIAYYKIVNKSVSEDRINNQVEKTQFIVRKIAHFTEFLILGLLIINVLKDYMMIDKKIVIISIIFSVLYAISDEIHQLFIYGRACRITDVFLDSVGSIIGISLFYKYKRKINNR